MKTLILAASAAAAIAAVPGLASAQTANPGTSFYGTLGYADSNTDHLNLGTIQGRVGARFGQYLGVEGELGFGVAGDKTTRGGVDVKANLQNQEAIYGVGFLPVSPQWDIWPASAMATPGCEGPGQRSRGPRTPRAAIAGTTGWGPSTASTTRTACAPQKLHPRGIHRQQRRGGQRLRPVLRPEVLGRSLRPSPHRGLQPRPPLALCAISPQGEKWGRGWGGGASCESVIWPPETRR